MLGKFEIHAGASIVRQKPSQKVKNHSNSDDDNLLHHMADAVLGALEWASGHKSTVIGEGAPHEHQD